MNTKDSCQYFNIPVILIDSFHWKDEAYYSKVFLEKYNFNKDIEIHSNNNPYYVDSDEEYFDEK